MSPADPATLFAALGDPYRLELLRRLGSGEPRAIAMLGGGMPISRQGLTKHLRTLERAGLVRSMRSGRETRYAIERERLRDAERFLAAVSKQWSDALGRLAEQLAAE